MTTETSTLRAATILRARWEAEHPTSMPSFEGSCNFVSHFDPDAIITTLRRVVTDTKTTGDVEVDAGLIRVRVQAALMAGEAK